MQCADALECTLLSDINTFEWVDVRTFDLRRCSLVHPESPIWRKNRRLGDIDNEWIVWSWKSLVLKLFTELKSLRASTDWLLCRLHGKRYGNPSYYPYYSEDASMWSFLVSVSDTMLVFKRAISRGGGRKECDRQAHELKLSSLFEGALPPYQQQQHHNP